MTYTAMMSSLDTMVHIMVGIVVEIVVGIVVKIVVRFTMVLVVMSFVVRTMVLWFTMVSWIVLNLSFVGDDRVEAMLIRGVCDGLQTTIRQVDIVDALGNVSFFILFVAKPCAMIRIFYFVDKSVAATSLMMVVVRITVVRSSMVRTVVRSSVMRTMVRSSVMRTMVGISMMRTMVRISVMFQCVVMIVKNRSMMDIMTIMM